MARSVTSWLLSAPFLVAATGACADVLQNPADPFGFDPALLDPIQFTRAPASTATLVSSRTISGVNIDSSEILAPAHQTEFSFRMKSRMPDFSREGAYGFNLFSVPSLNVNSRVTGLEAITPNLSQLHNGLEYSAGLRFEHEDVQLDGSAYVSSSLLGLSYGRLGRLWYGGVDVNLEQFSSDEFGDSPADILSFDVTTGRRLGFTGLDNESPLWLLSFQGNVDMRQWEDNDNLEASGDWYLNPSLFWQQPGFMFSAQMQVPVEFETLDEKGEPDYRLKAVFEKQFR